MSGDPREKRSFKILKKSPQPSPFFNRKSTKSDSATPDDQSSFSADENPNRSMRSFKLKTSSIGKLFKKRKSSHQSKSSSETVEVEESGPREVSFNHIICSTPLINNQGDVAITPEYITAHTDQDLTTEDFQTDESGIFSPSFLEDPFSPPPGFKQDVLTDSPSNTIHRESSHEKLFGRIKIPSIELTQPLPLTESLLHEVTSLGSIKDEEFVSSPLARNSSAKSKTSSKPDPYRIEVTVIGSMNLAARDSNGFPMLRSEANHRLSDPYCKVKVGLQRARTKVCPKNLNPLWEEKFCFVVESLDEAIRFKVMDYDRGFRDDLIGCHEMRLSMFQLDEYQTYTEELQDESGTENLGSIRFSIHISSDLSETPPPDVQLASISSSPPGTPPQLKKLVRKPTTYDAFVNKFLSGDQKLDERENQRSTSPFQEKHLSGILSITLVEAAHLRPMNKDGSSDPFCKFKLGNQKHKSKVSRRTLDPVWKERFEIRVYSDSSSILEISVFDYEEFGFSDNLIGSAEVDITEFEESKTYKQELDLDKDGGAITCLFNLSRIDENSEDSGCEVSPEDFVNLRKTYAISYNPLNYLTYKWEEVEDVGVLIVKIIKCIDLPESETIIGTSDPFCFIEVENTRVRTPTLYKTQDPVWNKQFKFNIKDIHSTLNIRVFDEERNKYNFLGCVKLPILEAHTIHRCLLKDRKLERVGFGEIFLETELIYNPIRAVIKTLLPAEENLLYEEPKFKRNLFMQNFKRVYSLATVALSLGLWLQRIYNWEHKAKSSIALLVYILVVVSFELYMVPMFAAAIILYEFLARWVGFKSFETWFLNEDLQEQVAKEDDSEDGEEFSITAKMKMVLGVCQTVQNSLDLVASYCERIKNVFNWTIPFLSFMAAAVLISGTILLYFIPLRWMILLWGINKLTVKLRDPGYEENQELLNFLCRLPSDVELNQMRVLTKESSKRTNSKNLKSRRHK